MAGFGGIFLAAIPLTSWVAQPNGMLEKAVNGVCSSVAFLSSAGSTSKVSQGGKIAALSALYITMTYALSGAGSAAGVDAGNKEGRDNAHPRKQVKNLEGLPLRLHSAHYNLMEMFPGFALSAALTQALAPGDQQLINLLGLHVLSKVFLYVKQYVTDVFVADVPQLLSKLLAQRWTFEDHRAYPGYCQRDQRGTEALQTTMIWAKPPDNSHRLKQHSGIINVLGMIHIYNPSVYILYIQFLRYFPVLLIISSSRRVLVARPPGIVVCLSDSVEDKLRAAVEWTIWPDIGQTKPSINACECRLSTVCNVDTVAVAASI